MGANQSRPAVSANGTDQTMREQTQHELDQALQDTTPSPTDAIPSSSSDDKNSDKANFPGSEQSWQDMFSGLGMPTREEQATLLEQATVTHAQSRRIKDCAISNCADLHSDLVNCFRDGTWSDWMLLCERQRHAFWRCVDQQEAVLRELNYAGQEGSTREQDFDLAMEADRIVRARRAKAEAEAAAAS